MTTAHDAETGVILSSAAYSLADLKKRLGLGVHAMRTARRKGLVVRRIGRRSFVLGSDLLRYIETTGSVVEGVAR